MILADKISLFIAKAQTRVRELQTALMQEFDYNGYQNDNSEELLLKIGETYDFVELLVSEDKGELTEKEIRDLIDFFIIWLDLNTVIAANYINYQIPVNNNILLPSSGVASSAGLAAEIAARIAADISLSNRITILEAANNDDPIFPAGFFDNYVADYSVVFDDDARLHTHDNIAVLDALTEDDLTNIQSLQDHFESIGTPGGQHVSQEDRDRWDVIETEVTDRIAADADLQDQIDALIPAGFFDNYVADYSVVFDDDVRLHTHANKAQLDELNVDDILNIKALVDHYLNIGLPFGIHVTAEDRERWDNPPSGDAEVYDGTSPTTLTIGGMPAGTALTGRTWQSIIEELLVEYINPTFTGFAVTDVTSIIEVGVALSGAKNFTWSTSSSGNVQTDSIAIRDVTGAVYLATGLANDGAQSIDIGTITNTSPMSRAWRAEGVNTILGTFVSSQDTVTSIYPYFYGKVASGGAAPGVARPAANQALIDSGTKVVAASSSTITINFGSTDDEYAWFAIPASMASKVSWYVNELNNGSIGGAVSPGGNLFPTAAVVEIDSPTGLWTNVDYKFYIANYQSAIASGMQMRNS